MCTETDEGDLSRHRRQYGLLNCDEEVDAPVDNTFPLPGAAHDIRVEPFARAMPRRSQRKYQLSVDISWQMPPNKLIHFFLSLHWDVIGVRGFHNHVDVLKITYNIWIWVIFF
uniref:Uncharacterized protein n=1 Tax=Ascaris lumbricoides TaxID=6252 RepID=A0A0M3IXA7_ASCLU